MTEAEFQADVIRLAEMRGWMVGHHHDSRRQIRPGVHVGDRQAAGVPDLILVGKRLVWAELKTDTGKLSLSQRMWLTRLAQAGCEVYLWRPADLEDVQRILLGKWRYWPRGIRGLELGRAHGGPLLRDESSGRVWCPGALWLPGRGRVDEQKERAA